tara:strand:+ start:94 stop:675 length:582 start_codon:yes stop_codon:yes gene_type:complete
MKKFILFPILIHECENKNHNLIKDTLVEECKSIFGKIKKGGNNWQANTFNTNGTYNLFNNKKFDSLNNWIKEQIIKYGNSCGFKDKSINSSEAWFNIYKKHDYQETHIHNFHDISAVYYLSVPKNSGDIVFYSFENNEVRDYFEEKNPFTWKTFNVKPAAGKLLVFKSNLKHGVKQSKSNQPKISLAYNFNLI